jgi:hypothetical protein
LNCGAAAVLAQKVVRQAAVAVVVVDITEFLSNLVIFKVL